MTNTTPTAITAATMPPIWYSAKRVIRTVLAVLVAIVLGLAGSLSAFALIAPQILDELKVILPPSTYVWLAGVVVFIVVLSGVVTRIMAIPGVNAWLTKIGAGSVPASAIVTDAAGTIVVAPPAVEAKRSAAIPLN
jgi:hypothetical protein